MYDKSLKPRQSFWITLYIRVRIKGVRNNDGGVYFSLEIFEPWYYAWMCLYWMYLFWSHWTTSWNGKSQVKWDFKPEVTKESIAATCLVYSGCFFWSVSSLFSASVQSIALHLTALWINNLCEAAFSQIKIIKLRYRSRLTDEHLKCLQDKINSLQLRQTQQYV